VTLAGAVASDREPIRASASLERAILVADDDEATRHALGRVLRSKGYGVHCASSGSEALAILALRPIPLVISDHDMPEMTGLELLREVRRRFPKVCRIMLTATMDLETVVRAINEGEIYRFIQKPWDNTVLAATVHLAFESLRLEAELAAERARSERLLLNVLPPVIAGRLKAGEATIADSFSDVTILFSDLVGFTELSARMEADALVSLLDEIFSEFDALAEASGLEKIKTVGDAYLVAAGVPTPRADHAPAIAQMAIEMLEALRRVNDRRGTSLTMRIGVNTGPVVAGVIGRRKFIYDLWGDAVNTASRMESHGHPGRIQITEATRRLVEPRYFTEERGLVDVKGKGPTRTFWLGPARESVRTPGTAGHATEGGTR
jgi:adenylate cyclase